MKLLEREPNVVVVQHLRPKSKLWVPEDGIALRGPLVVIDEPTILQVMRTENLRTNAGTDWQKNQMSGVVAAVANQIALSGAAQGTASTLAPAVADTVLAQELTTAVWSGLGRATGTYGGGAAGSPSYTVAKTGGAAFTLAAGGSGTPPVVVYGSGLFNAATAGTLVFEATFTSATLIVGDSVAITWTVTV